MMSVCLCPAGSAAEPYAQGTVRGFGSLVDPCLRRRRLLGARHQRLEQPCLERRSPKGGARVCRAVTPAVTLGARIMTQACRLLQPCQLLPRCDVCAVFSEAFSWSGCFRYLTPVLYIDCSWPWYFCRTVMEAVCFRKRTKLSVYAQRKLARALHPSLWPYRKYGGTPPVV